MWQPVGMQQAKQAPPLKESTFVGFSDVFSQTGVLVEVSLLALLQVVRHQSVVSLAAGAGGEGALIQHFRCPFLALLPCMCVELNL